MKLFVGLGNPGPRYADTRHNIGFMAVEAIAREHGFAPFRARFQGRFAEGRLGEEKVQILEPETYMNLSGQSVGEAMRFFRLTPADVVVFHDELDLPPGRLRVKQGGGHAGHNGLRSIIAHVGADFLRVRLGIGHPGDKDRVSDYVLSPFAKADAAWLEPLLDALAREAPALTGGPAAAFQNAVTRRLEPSKPPRPPRPERAPAQAAPVPEDAAEEDDPLGRLVERFRRDLDG